VTVLISGAGPVGLTLAAMLGRFGIPVAVFEAGPSLNPLSQASTFHASTLELLDEIEMAWPLIDTGKITQRLQYRDRAEGLIGEFDFNLLRSVTRFPIRLQTDQTELTRLLLGEISRRYPSVSIHFDSPVTGAAKRPGGVTLMTTDGGRTREWQGQVAVGADGAHSVVRKSAGITFEGSTYATRHLMITTTYDVTGRMPELAPVTYIFDQDEPVGVLRLRNYTRVVFMVSGPEPDEEVLRPDNLQRRLEGFLPAEPAPYPIVDARIARLHQRVASQYASGPIVLAGDAAHLNHPLGGMGLNAGIHDAYALGHAIHGMLRGGGDASALEEYATLRREQAVSHVIPAADGYSRDSKESSVDARRKRNSELASAAADPQLAFDYLYRASMFDSAPPRGERTAHTP
jgi:3-(3-hydroxy-phenyl)propionate hydroxylase